jgi:gliding motility-associated-like protein
VTYTITVNPPPPLTITAGTATGSISACAGTASASPYIQQFTVSANGLTGNIAATASTGFEVSLAAGSGYGSSVSLSPSGGSVDGAIVYVRSAASAPAGNRSGNVLLSSPGAKSLTVAVAGTISALPTVNTPKDQTVPNGASTTAVNFTGTGKVFNWTNDTPAIGLAASGTGDIPAFTAVNTGSSPVTATITVVPVSNQYAYIANFNANSVSVVNTATNTIIATIQVGSNPVGVSVSPDGKRVYVTNEQSNTVSVIDATNNTVITTIPVGKFPYGIAVSPDGQKVYVANDISYTVSVISAVTNTVTATIPLSTAACGVSISPDGSRIYVSNSIEPPGAVSVIDAASDMVITVIAVGAAPVGIISSPGGSKLYTANGGDNTVSVINTVTAATTTITVGNNPWGIAISQDGGTVYVANIDDNTVSVINTATNVVIATIPVGDGPYYLTVSPDGTLLYVENTFGNSISVINTTTNTVSSTIAGFSGPFSFGNFISVGSNCNGVPVKFKIIVNPAAAVVPTIITGTVTGSISACLGTASFAPNVQQFNVSGSILTGDITVTATPGFEVSLTEANGYGNSVTLPQTGGTVNNTVVYVRSAASATLGSISGNLLVSSAGAVSQTVAVTGLINGPVATSLSIAALPNGVCAGTAVTFTATPTNGGAAPVYQWLLNGNDTGENSTTFTSSTLINGDIVKCIMTSNAACAAPSNATSNSITVNVYPTPTVNAGGNKTIKAGSSILLNASDSGDITAIIWSPSTGLSNNKILNPVASPASTTTYTITVQTANGCEAMDTATIEVQIPGLIIPNTFTPNGDGVNDTWDIKNLNAYANCTVQIFNRWGQNVYSSIGYGTPWDGTYKGSPLPAGAYYYIINLKNGLGPLSGFVAMIR